MDEEIRSLLENKTWTLVELAGGRKSISNKWVYKTKTKMPLEIRQRG